MLSQLLRLSRPALLGNGMGSRLTLPHLTEDQPLGFSAHVITLVAATIVKRIGPALTHNSTAQAVILHQRGNVHVGSNSTSCFFHGEIRMVTGWKYYHKFPANRICSPQRSRANPAFPPTPQTAHVKAQHPLGCGEKPVKPGRPQTRFSVCQGPGKISL